MSAGLLAAQPTTAAPMAEEPIESEGAGMNLAKAREALAGLPDDASEDEVQAALAAVGLSTASPAQPAPAAAAAASEGDDALDKRVAAAASRGGVVTIDVATVTQFQEGMVRAAALQKRLEERDRDEAITEAVKAGKFPPARREHYERLWAADPAGTRELVASLAAGLVPVTASGYDTDTERDDDELDREIARLSGPPRSRRVA